MLEYTLSGMSFSLCRQMSFVSFGCDMLMAVFVLYFDCYYIYSVYSYLNELLQAC